MRTVNESSCSDGRVARGLVLTDSDGQNIVAFFELLDVCICTETPGSSFWKNLKSRNVLISSLLQ